MDTGYPWYNPWTALWVGIGLMGMMAVVFWPRKGLWAWWRRRRILSERILWEDALKHLGTRELEGRTATAESLAGVLGVSLSRAMKILQTLEAKGLVQTRKDGFALSEEGRRYAIYLIRAHRLWEQFLSEQSGLPESEWHGQAEVAEHRLTPKDVEELEARLGHPLLDPHGDPIPREGERPLPPQGYPLVSCRSGDTVRITHIEDEPENVYAELVRRGFYPGQILHDVRIGTEQITVQTERGDQRLSPVVARNLTVERVQESEHPPEGLIGLDQLSPGQQAEIWAILPRCRGMERRRLLDFGLLPGAQVQALFVSPTGDPVAYQVRDSVIALRREQAKNILVRPIQVEMEQRVA